MSSARSFFPSLGDSANEILIKALEERSAAERARTAVLEKSLGAERARAAAAEHSLRVHKETHAANVAQLRRLLADRQRRNGRLEAGLLEQIDVMVTGLRRSERAAREEMARMRAGEGLMTGLMDELERESEEVRRERERAERAEEERREVGAELEDVRMEMMVQMERAERALERARAAEEKEGNGM
jgi:hypothetical protein